MKKSKNSSNRKTFELIVIFCSVILFGWSILCDNGWLHIWNFLELEFLYKEELLLTLFGVQASVSTISIAIIALISGVISDSAYGISFTKFISNLKPYYLKHNRLIICSISIIAINYFLIS